jgi:hypothetical protein
MLSSNYTCVNLSRVCFLTRGASTHQPSAAASGCDIVRWPVNCKVLSKGHCRTESNEDLSSGFLPNEIWDEYDTDFSWLGGSAGAA